MFTIVVHDDNPAMRRVVETGKNPTMRYLHRTHRVSVSWLHECFKGKKDLDIVYEKSDNMCADIYTKAFTDKVKWGAVCGLINVVDPKEFSRLVQSKALDPGTEVTSKTGGGARAAVSELIGPPMRGFSAHRGGNLPSCGDCKQEVPDATVKVPQQKEEPFETLPTPSITEKEPFITIGESAPAPPQALPRQERYVDKSFEMWGKLIEILRRSCEELLRDADQPLPIHDSR